MALVCAQDVAEILNSTYVPRPQDEKGFLNKKCTFIFYSVNSNDWTAYAIGLIKKTHRWNC